MKIVSPEKNLDLTLQIAEEFTITYRGYSHLYSLYIYILFLFYFFPKKEALLFSNTSVFLRW